MGVRSHLIQIAKHRDVAMLKHWMLPCYCISMGIRTTITLDEEAYEIAKARAQSRKSSLGEAISQMILANNWTDYEVDSSGPFPKFKLPPDLPRVSMKEILEADAEL